MTDEGRYDLKTAEQLLEDMPYIVADAMLQRALESSRKAGVELVREEHTSGSCDYHYVQNGKALMSFGLTALALDRTHIWLYVPSSSYDQAWHDELLASTVRQMANILGTFTESQAGTRTRRRSPGTTPSKPRQRTKQGGPRQGDLPEDLEAIAKLRDLGLEGMAAKSERREAVYQAWLRKRRINKRPVNDPRGSFRQLVAKAKRELEP
jgi:hypothetical protein